MALTTRLLRPKPWTIASFVLSGSVLISQGLGIPDVVISAKAGVLGSLGPCTADFRDQYYGLIAYVLEGDPTSRRSDRAPLITTGLIEPAECLWGAAPTRFNKQKWEAPVVDLVQLKQDANARLGCQATRPEALVATQGAVIEAVVDEDGTWLPSVPVLTMTPSPELRVARTGGIARPPSSRLRGVNLRWRWADHEGH